MFAGQAGCKLQPTWFQSASRRSRMVFFAQRSARTAPRAPAGGACACAGPAAHGFGERSTTALDRMREGEKMLLPLILRLTPSPSSSTRRVGVRKEMQTPRCCSCRPYPIRSSWLPGCRSSLGPAPGPAALGPGPARSGSCHRRRSRSSAQSESRWPAATVTGRTRGKS
jgi:hypothetical protein